MGVNAATEPKAKPSSQEGPLRATAPQKDHAFARFLDESHVYGGTGDERGFARVAQLATLKSMTDGGRLSPEQGDFGAVLHRIALTVQSSLDVKEVLAKLANLTLEAIPADRCSLFLTDDSGTRLVPTLSIGQIADASLWQRFRNFGLIELKTSPARWKAFRAGRAVGFPDIAASGLIPSEFAEVFGARSALLMPLLAAREPLGLFALDWMEPGREFPERELALAEAIGSYAALAIRNARLYHRLELKARTQERMVELAGVLNSSFSLRSVLDVICSAFEEVLETMHCSVNLIDESAPNHLRTLSVRGVSWFASKPEGLSEIPSNEVSRVREVWKKSPEPVVYQDLRKSELIRPALIPESIASLALFPIRRPGELLGFVAAGFPDEAGLQTDRLETGQALADFAATAIGRAALHEGLRVRLQRLEILYRLSDVVSGTTELTSVLRELNRVLPTELGLRLERVALANEKIREAVGASSPTHEEMEAIRSWRALLPKRGAALPPRRTSKNVLVPIVHRNRVQGALVASLGGHGLDSSDEELLAAVGSGFAQVIYKSGLRRELANSEQRLAIAAERERIARDLHDSVGHLLTGIGMRLASYLPEVTDQVWRDRLQELKRLASEGSQEVRQAIYSLLFLQVRKQGLVRSLRELCRKFQATSGILTTFRVEGHPAPVSSAQENALFRVALEALMNVERHAKATGVALKLTYGTNQIGLSVRDDGVGLAHRDPFSRKGRHFGLQGVRHLMEEVGGEIKVKNAKPRGLFVEATIASKLPRGK